VARILVIEDDAAQRDVFTQLLYYNGFDVEHAPDAENGIKLALSTRPDVIIMDVMLASSGMDGLAATSMFKSSPTIGKIPIICMSAYDVDTRMVRRAGADEFLRKPFAAETLVKAVRRYTGWDRAPEN
jgi:CheY-like chemotaxis protein